MSEEVVNVCQFNDLDLLEVNSSFNSKGMFLILKCLNILQSSYLKKKGIKILICCIIQRTHLTNTEVLV